MAEDKRAAPSTAAMVGRYALTYAGLCLLVTLAYWALERWLGSAPGGNAMGIVVPFLAAMTTGQLYVVRAGQSPDKGTLWRWAALFWLVTMLISLALAGLANAGGALDGQFAEMLADPTGLNVLGAALAVMAVLLFFILRLGIGMGLRQGMRAARRS